MSDVFAQNQITQTALLLSDLFALLLVCTESDHTVRIPVVSGLFALLLAAQNQITQSALLLSDLFALLLVC